MSVSRSNYLNQVLEGLLDAWDSLLAPSSFLPMLSSSESCSLILFLFFLTSLVRTLCRTIGSERTDLFKAAALRGVKSLFPPQVRVFSDLLLILLQHNPYHAAFGANARDVRTFDRYSYFCPHSVLSPHLLSLQGARSHPGEPFLSMKKERPRR
jgi:hypothetical protein